MNAAKPRFNAKDLEILIRNTPAAVAMFNKKMQYMAYSDRWLKDYKVKEENILGYSHYDVFPDLLERWKDDHRRVLQGEIIKKAEDHWQREDGTDIYNKYELHPWRDEKGDIQGLIMFTEVITEQVQARKELEKSRENIALAIELEKKFLAQELHDGLGQELILLSMDQRLTSDVKDRVKNIIENLRHTCRGMVPKRLIDGGLKRAVEGLMDNLNLIGKVYYTGIIDNKVNDLPDALSIDLFRVVQEITNNILKHSGAISARLAIEVFEDEVRIEHFDNGKEFDYHNKLNDEKSFGLISMRNRILRHNGNIQYNTHPLKNVYNIVFKL